MKKQDKKQNKLLEQIYTSRAITVFSVFCVLFVVLLFVMRIDDIALYVASNAILAVSTVLAVSGVALFIFGKVKKETLRTFTAAFIGELVFFSALSAVLFAFLIKDTTPNDAFGVLLAYGITAVVLYTVYVSSREAFAHALAVGLGITGLYIVRYFQGGSRFMPLLIAVCVLFVAYALLSIILKKLPKTEKCAVCAATVFNIASSVLFAIEPPAFFYIVVANVVLFIVTRLFVKL